MRDGGDASTVAEELGGRKIRHSIGIFTSPIFQAGNVPVSNLIEILGGISSDIHLLTGNEGYVRFKDDHRVKAYGIQHAGGGNTLVRILRHAVVEFKLMQLISRISRRVDIWIFFIDAETLVLPMMISKLRGKKVILLLASSSVKSRESARDRLAFLANLLFKTNCALSDRLVLYSANLIAEWGLESHRRKISIAHEHFLDFDKFRFKAGAMARENKIGHIGRLSAGKGTLNLVQSIPMVLRGKPDAKFLIAGEGDLRDEIFDYLSRQSLGDKVELRGWIPHDNLADSLGGLKLVVIPSYTEGIPNLMLESMACGTPVLASAVGGIPDYIVDGRTGFLLRDNTPESIAQGIIRALESKNIDEIARAARLVVESAFTFEKTLQVWADLLAKEFDPTA